MVSRELATEDRAPAQPHARPPDSEMSFRGEEQRPRVPGANSHIVSCGTDVNELRSSRLYSKELTSWRYSRHSEWWRRAANMV